MSYTQIFYHIVLRTKHSENSIPMLHAPELYKYIWGVINNRKGKLYRINGMEDHVHILTSLHSTVPLADFVKDIKVASTLWMKSSPHFSEFKGWGDRYAAFTGSFKDKDRMIAYIKNQQEHHKKETFREELVRIFEEEGVEFDDRFLL